LPMPASPETMTTRGSPEPVDVQGRTRSRATSDVRPNEMPLGAPRHEAIIRLGRASVRASDRVFRRAPSPGAACGVRGRATCGLAPFERPRRSPISAPAQPRGAAIRSARTVGRVVLPERPRRSPAHPLVRGAP
jgi:hypothetical protein